jgi:hypothetical protein
MQWTLDKVAELSTDALQKLRANAISHPQMAGAAEALSLCNQVLAGRSIKVARTGRSRRPDYERNAEAEAAALLTAFAKGLLAKYDLSAATAKRLSQGTKGFRALELLGKSGAAKVGGLQLNGSLALDRYISYRMKGDRVSLAFVLLKDHPIDEARWVAVGPKRLMPDALPVRLQMVGLCDVPKGYVEDFGLVTPDFAEASVLFEGLLEQFAPPLSAG